MHLSENGNSKKENFDKFFSEKKLLVFGLNLPLLPEAKNLLSILCAHVKDGNNVRK